MNSPKRNIKGVGIKTVFQRIFRFVVF